jgi:hypothetical protein
MGNLIFLIEHKGEIAQSLAQIGFGVAGVCAVASAWLPKPAHPGVYADLRKAVDLIGQNYRNAKNSG